MSKLDIMYHHNSDEWETPQDLYADGQLKATRECHSLWSMLQ